MPIQMGANENFHLFNGYEQNWMECADNIQENCGLQNSPETRACALNSNLVPALCKNSTLLSAILKSGGVLPVRAKQSASRACPPSAPLGAHYRSSAAARHAAACGATARVASDAQGGENLAPGARARDGGGDRRAGSARFAAQEQRRACGGRGVLTDMTACAPSGAGGRDDPCAGGYPRVSQPALPRPTG